MSSSAVTNLPTAQVLRSYSVFSQLSTLPTLDLTELISDARKEQHIRRKPDSRPQDSVLFDLTRLDDTFAKGQVSLVMVAQSPHSVSFVMPRTAACVGVTVSPTGEWG